MRRARLDRPLLAVLVAIVLPGLATIYSAGQTDFPTVAAEAWKRQLVWLGIGLVAAHLVFRMSPRVLEWFTPYVYGLAIVVLLVTVVFGTGAGTAAGSKSWLTIAGVRVGQPAEFAKLATILMLARHLSTRRTPPQTLFELWPAGLIVLGPFLLIGLQPDLGSAIVLVGILFIMLYWAGVSVANLILVASPMISLVLAFSTGLWGAWIVVLTLTLLWLRPYLFEGGLVWGVNVLMGVVAVRLWTGLPGYQQNRILSFLNPEIDPRAAGWNVIQSKIAIGSGGWLGKGFTEGTQKRLAFLPAQHTDFPFAIVGEEFGFFGVAITLILFAVLLLVLVRIAREAVDAYSSLMVAGVAGLLFVHVVENTGMVVGLLPVTGIPLPFFSYGGSFLLVCMAGLALGFRTAQESQMGGY